MTKTTRKERAGLALEIAQRRVAGLTEKRIKHLGIAAELERQIKDAERRRDYLAESPDLITFGDAPESTT
jgi:hypothetical protein